MAQKEPRLIKELEKRGYVRRLIQDGGLPQCWGTVTYAVMTKGEITVEITNYPNLKEANMKIITDHRSERWAGPDFTYSLLGSIRFDQVDVRKPEAELFREIENPWEVL